MRQMRTSDLFKLSSIVRELNLKKELQNMSLDKANPEQFGVSLILILFENLDKAEDQILSFIADIAEVEMGQLKNMELDDFSKIIEQFKAQKGLGDFFRSLFKTEKAK